jgi:hypothetical protein
MLVMTQIGLIFINQKSTITNLLISWAHLFTVEVGGDFADYFGDALAVPQIFEVVDQQVLD